MAKRIFSITYMACLQRRFEEKIESGDLVQALNTLESFPNATAPSDKLRRLVVMCEGYRAIAVKYERPIENNRMAPEEYTPSEVEELFSLFKNI